MDYNFSITVDDLNTIVPAFRQERRPAVRAVAFGLTCALEIITTNPDGKQRVLEDLVQRQSLSHPVARGHHLRKYLTGSYKPEELSDVLRAYVKEQS